MNLDASITANWGARAYSGPTVCNTCDGNKCVCHLPMCEGCLNHDEQCVFDGEVYFCPECMKVEAA